MTLTLYIQLIVYTAVSSILIYLIQLPLDPYFGFINYHYERIFNLPNFIIKNETAIWHLSPIVVSFIAWHSATTRS